MLRTNILVDSVLPGLAWIVLSIQAQGVSCSAHPPAFHTSAPSSCDLRLGEAPTRRRPASCSTRPPAADLRGSRDPHEGDHLPAAAPAACPCVPFFQPGETAEASATEHKPRPHNRRQATQQTSDVPCVLQMPIQTSRCAASTQRARPLHGVPLPASRALRTSPRAVARCVPRLLLLAGHRMKPAGAASRGCTAVALSASCAIQFEHTVFYMNIFRKEKMPILYRNEVSIT